MAGLPRFSGRFSSLEVTGVRLTGRRLGKGSDATVEEVEWQGTFCAAKILHEILLDDDSPGGSQRFVEGFVKECWTWSKLSHPHVAQFLGVYFRPGSTIPILLLEKMDTSLRTFLEENHKVGFLLPDKIFVLLQVVQGLAYLHSRKPALVHHDLSPNNILLNREVLLAKLTDFGMSRVVDPSGGSRKSSVKGTQAFMSPEALIEPPRYNEKLDVFSFGNVIITTLTYAWPIPGAPNKYKGDKLVALSEFERREQYVIQFSPEESAIFVGMVHSCLDNRPNLRPTSLHLVGQMRQIEKDHPRKKLTGEPAEIEQLHAQLREKDTQLQTKDTQLRENATQLQAKDTQLQAKGTQLRENATQLQAKDTQLRENATQLRDKDTLVIQLLEENQRLQQEINLPQKAHQKPSSAEKPASSSSPAKPFKPVQNKILQDDEQCTFLLNLQDDSNSTAPPDYKEACRDVHRFPPAASQDSLRGAVGSNEFEEYFEAKAEQKVLSEMCWFPFGFKTAIFGPEGGVLAIEKEADLNDAGPPGLMYTYVEVPPNSVRDGQHIIIHCGITPFGPFEFPGGHTPCSMIVYLVVRGDTLLKPVYLNNPSWAANEVENGRMRCFVAPHTPSENKFKFEPFHEDSYKASPQSCCITIDGTGCLFFQAIEKDKEVRQRGDADRSHGYDGRPCDRLFLYRCHVFREEAKNIQTKQLLIAFTFNSLAWGEILKKFYHPPSCEYDTSSAFGLSKDKTFFSLKIQAMEREDWLIRVKGVKEVFACHINYWETSPAALESSVVGRIYPPNLLCVVHQQPPKTMPIDVQVLGPDRNIAYQAIVLYNPPELSQDSLVPRNSRSSTQASLMSTDVDRSCSGLSYVSEASPNSTVSRTESDFGRASIPHSQLSPIPTVPRRQDVVQVPTAPMAGLEDKINSSLDICGVAEYNKGLIGNMTMLGAVLGIEEEAEAIINRNGKIDSQLLEILKRYIAKKSPTWCDFCTALKRHCVFNNVREKIERDHHSST